MSTLLFLATSAAPSPGLAAACLNLMVAWLRSSPLLGSSRCLRARVRAFWTEQPSPIRGARRRMANYRDRASQPRTFAFRRRRPRRYLPDRKPLSDVPAKSWPSSIRVNSGPIWTQQRPPWRRPSLSCAWRRQHFSDRRRCYQMVSPPACRSTRRRKG